MYHIKKLKKEFDKLDKKITFWMKRHGLKILRYSLGFLFVLLGILKPLGLSAAAPLVAKTVYWFSPSWFVPFLGWWEVVIGICLLYKPLVRLGIFLMALQMLGTFLPLIILPEVVYSFNPLTLTLEGQYIIKNLVLIAAAIVLGGHVRDKK